MAPLLVRRLSFASSTPLSMSGQASEPGAGLFRDFAKRVHRAHDLRAVWATQQPTSLIRPAPPSHLQPHERGGCQLVRPRGVRSRI